MFTTCASHKHYFVRCYRICCRHDGIFGRSIALFLHTFFSLHLQMRLQTNSRSIFLLLKRLFNTGNPSYSSFRCKMEQFSMAMQKQKKNIEKHTSWRNSENPFNNTTKFKIWTCIFRIYIV